MAILLNSSVVLKINDYGPGTSLNVSCDLHEIASFSKAQPSIGWPASGAAIPEPG